MKDLSFCYPTNDAVNADSENTLALERINMDVHVGETIVLAGASGSGKSTLIKLIPRHFESIPL